MVITVFNQTFNFSNSQPFARRAIRLITDRWGTALSGGGVPVFIQHKAFRLGQLFAA